MGNTIYPDALNRIYRSRGIVKLRSPVPMAYVTITLCPGLTAARIRSGDSAV